jgi:threonine synthase
MADRSFVTHLESALDGTRYEAGRLQTTHEGRPLWVRYDLPAVKSALSRDDLAGREPTMWRYRELLPIASWSDRVTLGETMTPLLPAPRLGRRLGLANLLIKDESRLPTGSFKARGMAMAVSMASSLGVKVAATPTAGNAGGALAAYAAAAGMKCVVFMPQDTPLVNRLEAGLYGAKAFLVNGLIHDCGRLVAEGAKRFGWFDFSTLKEPYRLEGKKTMGLELAEQLEWDLPDAIFYPTGGGTGLIGMWKAFAELGDIGWLAGEAAQGKRPRMYACQSDGCDPIVRAFERGERFAETRENAATIASGLRVPRAVGDFMILDAVRASGGKALRAREDRLRRWMALASADEGIAICPETAACLDALEEAVRAGEVKREGRVVVFNTGAAQKYVEAMEGELPRLDVNQPDWSGVEKALA